MEIISYMEDLNNLDIDSDSIIIPIFENDKNHPKRQKTIIIYICRLSDKKEWLITTKHHSESISDIDKIIIPEFKGRKFVIDKKNFLYSSCGIDDAICLSTYYFLKYNKKLKTDIGNQNAKKFFTNKYKALNTINSLVPLYEHYETSSKIANRVLKLIENFKPTSEFKIFNNLGIPEFKKIEENGLYIDKSELLSSFGLKMKKVPTDNKLYSSYTFNTITGRPSNTYNKINFAALNKTDNTRKAIISRFGNSGMLLEYDYIAYHLKLIATLIGFDAPKSIDYHKYMAQQYFGRSNVTEKEINEGKIISFRLLYGGITKEYEHIEFYKQLTPIVDLLWRKYLNDNNEYLPTTERIVKGIKNKYKLFSYIIQNLETKRNITIIKKINDYLETKKTKIILYTYDSFLLDYCMDDGHQTLLDITNIITENDDYNIRFKAGINYKDMKNFSLKTQKI